MDDVLKELEKKMAGRPTKEDRGALWIGIAFALAALAFPIYQAFLWLQTGVWTPLPISSLLHVPMTEWVGLQKIITWLFDLPVLVIPAFAAFGSFSAWKDST